MKILRLSSGFGRLDHLVAQADIARRSLAGHRDYRRFVIVGIARTGSTLLTNLLNAHEQVLAFGELFRGDGQVGWDLPPFHLRQGADLLAMAEREPARFLEREVFRKWPAEVQAVGFKLFHHHAGGPARDGLWQVLRDDPSIDVIRIRRMNVLEQYLSLVVAHRTNVWSTSSAQRAGSPLDPVVLEPEACRAHFELVREQEGELDAFFAAKEPEQVTYEDLAMDRAATMARVFRRLGVEPQAVEPRILRQRSQPLEQAIANFAELRGAFAGSRWETYFHQPDTVAARREKA